MDEFIIDFAQILHDSLKPEGVVETMGDNYVDSVGGTHGGGTGYNPQGVWCGECSNTTCAGCHYQNATEEGEEL